MNAFDFNQSYGHTPAVILDPSTGEVQQTIRATAPTSTSGTTTAAVETQPASSTAGSSGSSGSGTSRAATGASAASTPREAIPRPKVPALVLTTRSTRRSIRFTIHTRGGSNVATSVRLRLRHGRALVANRAARVRDHRAVFTVRRGAKTRAGRYRITMTVDAGGAVASATRTVRIAG
jgi:hypothetical protein